MKRRNALGAFLAYLEDIEQAIARREALRVTALLRRRTATHLPREVREELLMVSRQPRESLRAPVRFYSFQHRMRELEKGGERLPTAQIEMRLERRQTAGTIRLREAGERRAARHAVDVVDVGGIIDMDRNDNGGEPTR